MYNYANKLHHVLHLRISEAIKVKLKEVKCPRISWNEIFVQRLLGKRLTSPKLVQFSVRRKLQLL